MERRPAWSATPDLEPGGFGRVTKDGLSYRTGPDTASAKLGHARPRARSSRSPAGPVCADGYTWFEVTQPIKEWSTGLLRRAWRLDRRPSSVPGASSGHTGLPSTRRVDAGIVGLDFGTSGVSRGVGGPRPSPRTAHVLAQRRRQRGRPAASAGPTPSAMDVADAQGLPHGRDRWWGAQRPRRWPSGTRAWTWDGKVGGTRRAGRPLRAPALRARRGQDLPRSVGPPVTAAQRQRIRRPDRHRCPRARLGLGLGTAHLAEWRRTRGRPSGSRSQATGATRWTLAIAGRSGAKVRSAPRGARSASPSRGAAPATRGAACADGRYSATLAAWDAAGNHGARTFAITVDTDGADDHPDAAPAAFSPERRRRRTTPPRCAGPATEKLTGTARPVQGHDTRPFVDDVRHHRMVDDLERTHRLGHRASRRRIHLQGCRAGRRRQPPHRVEDGRGRPHRRPAPLVAAASSRRTGRPQPTSSLTWTLTRTATTTLRLYDAQGSLVRTVWNGKSQAAGTRSWTWDGRLADGRSHPRAGTPRAHRRRRRCRRRCSTRACGRQPSP